MRLPRLCPATPPLVGSSSCSSVRSKRCMNTSRHRAPLRASATSDMRKSPNGSCRRNSSMRRRELPPLSDIVTTALMFMGYFFKCERTENVPDPPNRHHPASCKSVSGTMIPLHGVSPAADSRFDFHNTILFLHNTFLRIDEDQCKLTNY